MYLPSKSVDIMTSGPQQSTGVRVEASTLLPAGSMAGPYPGHFLLGYIITDERHSTHVLKVKHSCGKLQLDQGREEEENKHSLSIPTWLAYIAAARDRHEQTVEAIRDPRGLIFYRMLRDIRPGEELAVWYGDELARDCSIPVLTPTNIRGNQEYGCARCPKTFQFPNTLKAHMRFHCPAQSISQIGMASSTILGAHLDAMREREHPRLFPFSHSMSSEMHTAVGSAFTPIMRKTESRRDSPQPGKLGEDKEIEDKRTPPTAPSQDGRLHSTGGLSRSLFPESPVSPPHPAQMQLLQNSHPLLRYYQSLYPAAPSHMPLSTGAAINPHLIQAYRSLFPMYSPMYPAHQHIPSPSDIRNVSPPQQSPPGFIPTASGPQHHLPVPGFYPMPSDKDGEPLDLLPKSLYMNKARKGHYCIYCGKLYSRKYGLKIHLRTHTGYKPLKCKVCLRPFGDPSNLNKHIRLHAEGDTPYRCDFCGKVLVRRRDLERHIKSRHPNEFDLFESKRLGHDLKNQSVDIDANDNELDGSDDTDAELDEDDEDCCGEIEVD